MIKRIYFDVENFEYSCKIMLVNLKNVYVWIFINMFVYNNIRYVLFRSYIKINYL